MSRSLVEGKRKGESIYRARSSDRRWSSRGAGARSSAISCSRYWCLSPSLPWCSLASSQEVTTLSPFYCLTYFAWSRFALQHHYYPWLGAIFFGTEAYAVFSCTLYISVSIYEIEEWCNISIQYIIRNSCVVIRKSDVISVFSTSSVFSITTVLAIFLVPMQFISVCVYEIV